MNRFILFAVIAVVAAVAIVWLSSNRQQHEISVAEAAALYASGVFSLDVRQPEEWVEYHIPGTTLIPLSELQSRTDEIPRDQKVVVVCRSGNRSQTGRDILLEAGFSDVTSMAGGLTQWSASGYPTVSGS